MNVLVWHVHGSWTTSFVQGEHTYLLPVTPDRGPWGGGRAAAWDWPPSAVEIPVERLCDEQVDVVVLQRPEEERLAHAWLGRAVPVVYLEHNTPRGPTPDTRHPMADRADLRVVHVTHFNDLMWDCGSTVTMVIPHGVPDPGHRYRGGLERAAVVLNEPVRRWRVTGSDLLPAFARVVGLDLFGMAGDGLATRLGLDATELRWCGDHPQHLMHEQLADRRLYLHPLRWTSLGLSLIEAMLLGMPVVALATTEAVTAVPPGAGVLATDVSTLVAATRVLATDHDLAVDMGWQARRAALERFALAPFLAAWDRVLADVG